MFCWFPANPSQPPSSTLRHPFWCLCEWSALPAERSRGLGSFSPGGSAAVFQSGAAGCYWTVWLFSLLASKATIQRATVHPAPLPGDLTLYVPASAHTPLGGDPRQRLAGSAGRYNASVEVESEAESSGGGGGGGDPILGAQRSRHPPCVIWSFWWVFLAILPYYRHYKWCPRAHRCPVTLDTGRARVTVPLWTCICVFSLPGGGWAASAREGARARRACAHRAVSRAWFVFVIAPFLLQLLWIKGCDLEPSAVDTASLQIPRGWNTQWNVVCELFYSAIYFGYFTSCFGHY